MFRLKQQVKDGIEKSTGLTVGQISSMSVGEINKHLENKLHKKLHINPTKDSRLMGRGSVYINLRRFLSLKKTDRKLSHI